MKSRRIKIVAVSALIISLSSIQGIEASSINRVFGWTDKIGLTLADTNVVYGPGGAPCLTQQFKSVCDPNKSNLSVVSALGPCSSFKGACILEVWIQDESGTYQKGSYVGERVRAELDYSWDDTTIPGIPRAHASNLYKFNGLKHSQGDLYEVIPMQESSVNAGNIAQPENLSLIVRPVYLDTKTKGMHPGCLAFLENTGPLDNVPCWRIAQDPRNPKIRVTLSFPTLPYGWVTGRIANVAISTSESTESFGGSLLTISGRSTRVPNIMRSFSPDIPSEKETWADLSREIHLDAWDKPYSLGTYYPPSTIVSYVSLLKKFPWMDKATSESDSWVTNFSWDKVQQISNQCKSNSLIGYVGSNAMTFESQIPNYSEATHLIEYRVASPHLFSDGSVDLGQYELLLNQSIAKCVWNVTEIPNIASLQVLSQDGTTKVATSAVQVVGNFIRFNASGFTFSEAKIIAGLSSSSSTIPIEQPEKEVFNDSNLTPAPITSPTPLASPLASPTPTNSPTFSSGQTKSLKSITCKNKSKKLLVTKAPYKCPPGYTKQITK